MAVAAMGLALLVGQSSDQKAGVLRARELVIVDAAGNRVCELGSSETEKIRLVLRHAGRGSLFLGMNADGSPRVVLSDHKDSKRLALGLEEKTGTPALIMLGTSGAQLATLGITPDGGVQLLMTPEGSATHVGIDARVDGKGQIYIADNSRSKVLSIVRSAKGVPGISIRTANGRMGLGGMTHNSLGMLVEDSANRLRATFGFFNKEVPALLLRDANGVDRVELIVKKDGSGHQYIRAEDKRVQWQAPE